MRAAITTTIITITITIITTAETFSVFRVITPPVPAGGVFL